MKKSYSWEKRKKELKRKKKQEDKRKKRFNKKEGEDAESPDIENGVDNEVDKDQKQPSV